MINKRVIILSGHYGSGKTNIAVNLALELRKKYPNVAVTDLDTVNPYYRTSDSAALFAREGIKLIRSDFANTNLDIPALPKEIYAATNDKSLYAVLDVGGDGRGALALGRLAPSLQEDNNFAMLLVINKFRPLTATAEDTVKIMREIEYTCKLKFNAIVNNSNLGEETVVQDVLDSADYAKEVSKQTNLPIAFTAVKEDLINELKGKIPNLFPMSLQKKI